MAIAGRSSARIPCALAFALSLGACGGDSAAPDPLEVSPAGRLEQQTLRGPIFHTTETGWRTTIESGAITVKPPAGQTEPGAQYGSVGMREFLGAFDLRAWVGNRRSILLPGGAKITLHGQGGLIIRLSIYDGAESHEIDVLTQTIMHSQVDGAVSASRDRSEHDGETAHLVVVRTRPSSSTVDVLDLLLTHLYVQNSGADGIPLKEAVAPVALGRQAGGTAYAFSDPAPVFPTQVEAACDATPQLRGGMSRHPDGALEYASRSGRWTVLVNQHQIIATRKMGGAFASKWEVWGDPHENLNGKHIKDWEGTRRTLLLDDGTKITMDALGAQGLVHTTSIYDGAQSHEIGNAGNQLRHSCVHAQTAMQRDAAEYDGEAAFVMVLRSPTSIAGSLFSENIYTETPGTAGDVRIFSPAILGETGEQEVNSNQVNDFYDDPRLGHT
jgi:hypothetical protein